jgi:hypothetical protein
MNTNQTVGAENTPVPGLRPFSYIRGFESSGGENIDMTNNQAHNYLISQKRYNPIPYSWRRSRGLKGFLLQQHHHWTNSVGTLWHRNYMQNALHLIC